MAYRGQRKKGIKSGSARKKSVRRVFWVVAALVIAGAAALALWPSLNEKGDSGRSETAGTVQGQAGSRADSAGSYQDFHALIGRWLRPDGGYVIKIRNIDALGKMDAGYYNPHSINVSRAEASRVGNDVKIFIELQDTGYPGSTYTLFYNVQKDVLEGIYYQAAQRQNYNVVFVRMK